MTEKEKRDLGKTLWDIANRLRGSMDADGFRDYMLAFLFLRYLSGNYELAASKELGPEYPDPNSIDNGGRSPLTVWYEENPGDVADFEDQMKLKTHYIIKPEHMWASLAHMAKTQHNDLLTTLQEGFNYIETESFQSTFSGLFSEINLTSEKLGKDYPARNTTLCKIIAAIDEGLPDFSATNDDLGNAYEYLIGQFAAGSGKKAGEFYTPQQISSILSEIVTLDSQDPQAGRRVRLASVMDFACGSGSLLLNVRNQMGEQGITRFYGQEKNITTYNLARMNMLLRGVKDNEFEIHHGDTLTNEWPMLQEENPAQTPSFDAIVANPPFSYDWDPGEAMGEDRRFRNYGLAPKSTADFAFLLHGFHYLADDGVMAIILPHGVLFRGKVEEKIRRKLLDDGHIDTVIGLPAKLFYSTGIPVCILVLKKCNRPDDVLFINAAEHFEKAKKQNKLTNDHIRKIVDTYKERPESIKRYAKRVGMDEIRENGYNLNITRYVSTAREEEQVDLSETHSDVAEAEKKIQEASSRHNIFLQELGLPPLP
ncbi:MAG: type I restriction-modification system subunit M [Paracoccaceae bacterium]|nr:type I restriction-modification system subunit M [Paracoccaceae bacterium]MYJ86271.1 type I restriction-modification system subunit M [Paracoccaceae bacterium]